MRYLVLCAALIIAAPAAAQKTEIAIPEGKAMTPARPAMDAFLAAVAAAQSGPWTYGKKVGKCLQYSGDVAREAGAVAMVGAESGKTPQPHEEYKRISKLGGQKVAGLKITALEALAGSGDLKPGMLIHVKQHFKEKSAYKPKADGHHWFIYIGLVKLDCKEELVPIFADNIHAGVDHNPKGQLGRSESKLCLPKTVGGRDVDWTLFATAKQVLNSVDGMTWPRTKCPEGKEPSWCKCKESVDGDPDTCRGGQKVTGIYDPWAQ